MATAPRGSEAALHSAHQLAAPQNPQIIPSRATGSAPPNQSPFPHQTSQTGDTHGVSHTKQGDEADPSNVFIQKEPPLQRAGLPALMSRPLGLSLLNGVAAVHHLLKRKENHQICEVYSPAGTTLSAPADPV